MVEVLHASTLQHMQAIVLCADTSEASIATFVRGGRDAGVPTIAGWITKREIVVVHDLKRRDEVTWPPAGCPECARLHAPPADAQSVDKPLRAGVSADLETATNLLVLAVCNALDVARGLRPADTRATAFDLELRSVIAEPVRPHHACTVCFPIALRGRDALRADVLRWRDDILAERMDPCANDPVLRERLRALTGRRFAAFEEPQATSPLERHATWRFFRARGVEPKDNALANAASTFVRHRRDRDEETISLAGTGFDLDGGDAPEVIALAESLERLFALSFGRRERVVTARYTDIVGEALDPRLFPLFAEAQYAAPDFPLARFDPDTPIEWVWGLDLAAGTPILVAADLVFASRAPASIYQANSNGAACHASLPQAVVNGLCETVERDALMVAWLNRLSLPRVAIGVGDPDPWSVRATLAQLDFDLEHVDLTTDVDIPVLLAVLRDRRNPDFFMLNMVASTDPQAQLRKLYRELAQFIQPYLGDSTALSNACTFDDNPDRVVAFPDHVAYYQSARRNREACFLTAGPATRRFGAGTYLRESHGARSLLETLAARLALRGHRTIVVNCSAPLLRDAGMHAVKVLVPGLQPLNCGHRLRALGGERVVALAQRMGYAPRRRAVDELNPWPHPFW
jgi:ribosomal protein S12 methylthiotransferase accessory factor